MKPFVWSYSAIEQFDNCPEAFHDKYILGRKSEPTPALLRGREIHKSIEDYLKGEGMPPADNILDFMPLVNSIARMSAGKNLLIEHKMAVTESLCMCAFFTTHVWGRGVADIIILDGPNAFIGDWKDGKKDKPWSYVLKYEKRTQLAILALFVFKHFPAVQKITACNIWLEHGKLGPVYTFDRSGEAAGWLAVIAKVNQIQAAIAANKYAMMPGPLCRYCSNLTCPSNRS